MKTVQCLLQAAVCAACITMDRSETDMGIVFNDVFDASMQSSQMQARLWQMLQVSCCHVATAQCPTPGHTFKLQELSVCTRNPRSAIMLQEV